MPEAPVKTHNIQIQYAAQVAADLDRNTKEQQRIAAEAAALEEQLHALQRDHAVLVSIQQALGDPATTTQTPEDPARDETTETAQLPQQRAPRRQSKTSQRKKKTSKASKTSAEDSDTKTAPGKATKPTLVALVREHLTQHTEPCSATEITTALTQRHPDRTIKTNVVRTTVENLVAKSQAQRTKQGAAVFYTATQATPSNAD